MSEVVRRCHTCGQETKVDTGLHNWKNLFKAPSLNDWLMLFIIAMVLFAAYAYKTDTATCRETLANLDKICVEYRSNVTSAMVQQNLATNNLLNISLYLNSSVDDPSVKDIQGVEPKDAAAEK